MTFLLSTRLIQYSRLSTAAWKHIPTILITYNSNVGIIAYADDIVLLAPTAHAMRCMLSTCEAYAAD